MPIAWASWMAGDGRMKRERETMCCGAASEGLGAAEEWRRRRRRQEKEGREEDVECLAVGVGRREMVRKKGRTEAKKREENARRGKGRRDRAKGVEGWERRETLKNEWKVLPKRRSWINCEQAKGSCS